MTLTPFESWLVPAMIVGLTAIVGFLLVQALFTRKKKVVEGKEDDDAISLLTMVKSISLKIDQVILDVNKMKTSLAVGSEKFLNTHKEIREIKDQVVDHEGRIRVIEKQHAKNHNND